ncbi:MAG: membrane lipoprotein lipid attachment site-containing protein [Bacilli bacterium]|nr:membrane lipoprotein lipid attachment site-containing protein [Bacilli bacterium]
MKKLFCFFLILFVLTGCGNMNNTPTKKVEAFLNKYQTNDKDVMDDLNDVLLFDSDLTDNERNDYREFMKKHYQDMTYKIKDETIDGDTATVEVEITVRSYTDAVNEANNYRLENASEFDTNNTFASYRLDKIKKVKDMETYTINFYLNKIDEKWVINPLSSDDESKINGLYGVNDINNEIIDTNNDTKNTESTDISQQDYKTDNAQNTDNDAS